ncbi:hypothetical protein ACFFV7_00295 [Nonomuraea spiralis]|uniref:Uncharacterized protein n=1 Tax=Nonomuraea spiralis TaxID=46182 RepID=A0ABV5I5M2_9ACTN|nr:hypothetical protein [Nonomuraea spiralis]GGS62472.1 hypothetical protein GCM10010176_000580 [Nonomuraea spiralis]
MSDHESGAIDAQAAHQALRLAGAARAAARARPPAPAWFAPTRGVLFAAGFGLLTGPWAQQVPVLTAGIVVLVAFLGVHAAVVSRGGVVTMPSGSPRRRLLNQLVPAVAYGLGWPAAVPFGQGGGAVCAAVLGGAALWAVTARGGSRP